MSDLAPRPRSRRPGDVVIRRERLRPETVVVAPRKLPRRPPPPAFVLAATFVVAILLGTVLLMLPVASATGEWTSPRVAFFTATSAVTITGLVVVDTATHWSGVGHVMILIMIQLGGLGFMTGASLAFILLGRRLSLQERLLVREAIGLFSLGQVGLLVRRIAIMMFIFEAAGTLVLFAHFLGSRPPAEALWFAVFHAVSAFNNAGFDLFGDFQSLIAFQSDPVVLLTIAALIILGGLSYLTIADVVSQRSVQRLGLDTKIVLVTSIVLWTLGFVAILGAEWNNPNTLGPFTTPQKALNAFFQSITARSGGFSSFSTGAMTEQSLFLTIGLMFIGGASASTAGGIRINTFSILLVAIMATVIGRREVHVFRRTIPPELINRALAIALLSVALVFLIAYLLAITERHPFLPVLFEAASAFGTVGLSTGITPRLSTTGSLIVALSMFVGRLGPLTLAILLAGRLVVPRVRYANEPVRVG